MTSSEEQEKKPSNYKFGHYFMMTVTLKSNFSFDIPVRGAHMKSEIKFQESFGNKIDIREITEKEYNKKLLGA